MKNLYLPILAPRLAALAAENLFSTGTLFDCSNILLNSGSKSLLNLTFAC